MVRRVRHLDGGPERWRGDVARASARRGLGVEVEQFHREAGQ
ncbi:hypothetical protein ACFQ1I_09130 [Kitasatospora arboriphila]